MHMTSCWKFLNQSIKHYLFQDFKIKASICSIVGDDLYVWPYPWSNMYMHDNDL